MTAITISREDHNGCVREYERQWATVPAHAVRRGDVWLGREVQHTSAGSKWFRAYDADRKVIGAVHLTNDVAIERLVETPASRANSKRFEQETHLRRLIDDFTPNAPGALDEINGLATQGYLVDAGTVSRFMNAQQRDLVWRDFIQHVRQNEDKDLVELWEKYCGMLQSQVMSTMAFGGTSNSSSEMSNVMSRMTITAKAEFIRVTQRGF